MLLAKMATSQQPQGSLPWVLVKRGCDLLIRLARTSLIFVLFQSLTTLLQIKECHWQRLRSIISNLVRAPALSAGLINSLK